MRNSYTTAKIRIFASEYGAPEGSQVWGGHGMGKAEGVGV
jgi:hypothetical protein